MTLLLTFTENWHSDNGGHEKTVAMISNLPLMTALKRVRKFEKAHMDFHGPSHFSRLSYDLIGYAEMGHIKESEFPEFFLVSHCNAVETLPQDVKDFE